MSESILHKNHFLMETHAQKKHSAKTQKKGFEKLEKNGCCSQFSASKKKEFWNLQLEFPFCWKQNMTRIRKRKVQLFIYKEELQDSMKKTAVSLGETKKNRH